MQEIRTSSGIAEKEVNTISNVNASFIHQLGKVVVSLIST